MLFTAGVKLVKIQVLPIRILIFANSSNMSLDHVFGRFRVLLKISQSVESWFYQEDHIDVP